MPTEFAFDVFLNHNAEDKLRVRRVAERLRDADLRVWFDEWSIAPGADIYLAIERGLETSHTLVVFLSPSALGSDWVHLERGTALFRDPVNAERRFLPVLLKDCDLPDENRAEESGTSDRQEVPTSLLDAPGPSRAEHTRSYIAPEHRPIHPGHWPNIPGHHLIVPDTFRGCPRASALSPGTSPQSHGTMP